jgi:hypothetical protein
MTVKIHYYSVISVVSVISVLYPDPLQTAQNAAKKLKSQDGVLKKTFVLALRNVAIRF